VIHPQTRISGFTAPVPAASRPVVIPIYQTSTFAFEDPDDVFDALHYPNRGFAYSRHSNPTVRTLEDAIADLEGGAAGLAVSSGMGAISTALLALAKPGAHIIAQSPVYGGTHSMLTRLADRFDIAVSRLSANVPAELAAAIRPDSRVLYLETIANPTTDVADLPAMIDVARTAGLTSIVDNTFATPLLCRPLEFGADIVIHSATKYLGGHDDVIAGVMAFARPELHDRIWRMAVDLGVAADPFAAWLVLRGLKTLPFRMAAHCDNAGHLARFLSSHPQVRNVRWPGLASHPDHERASQLLAGYGGVLSCDLTEGRTGVRSLVKRLRHAVLAPSLGGPRTLLTHPATTSHRELGPDALRAAGLTDGTVRISAGLEHYSDLIADFEQALRP
jgi:cystathionine beta-lyase/cystathionine gamma-synthase